MTHFSDFGLAAPVLRALDEEGYTTPTPIQAQAIPPALAGRDVCGIAQTGTGKTAAFALPILHRLAASPARPAHRSCRALVLSPTRELASQIAESFQAYGRHLRLSTTVVFGGVSPSRHERAVAGGIDVLVATPGRLLDLVDRRALNLSNVEVLVLDEADQMLDLGFIHDLKRIVKLLPRERQSLFFSATMPKSIAELAGQYIRNPVQVAVTPVATTAERVEQSVIFVPTQGKPNLLATILGDKALHRVLVFTRTKHGADKVVRGLDRVGIAASAIHGNKSQPQRERALAAFKDGSCRVLVATDIAARGIDVEAVSHVIQFDLPNVPEQYVHRIGRTARAGADGLAISFCNDEERAYLRDIERLTRQKVPVAPLPAGFAMPAPGSQEPDRAPRPHGERGRHGRPGQQPHRHGKPASQHGRRDERPRQGEPARPHGQADRQGAPAARQPRPQEAGGRPHQPGAGRPRRHRAGQGGGGQGGGGQGGEGRTIGWLDRAAR